MQMSEKDVAALVKEISGSDVKKCMKCGKCSATCPAYGEMRFHPHQFVSMVARGRVEELLKDPTVTRCLSCFACVERCPRGVEPANVVAAIRVLAEREQEGSNISPADVPKLVAGDPEIPQQALVSAFRKYRK
ncbi:MAG: 4Fe-4S dicluster domain-containing protein [Clostridia bacterium]|nr:4Fe-4S dicluster domain-containing protein [Clostridia bacterium]MBQ3868310.1 4Fe-4S dicluster domain-containing protein [Clostridia bacterium]MBR0157657.1 4Fe-4S dicluster domain-containing protein [Clostridia bacterium]MBR7062241.1 4Fe-4S dicluster domain-containing protein [Clostridia bacterium]